MVLLLAAASLLSLSAQAANLVVQSQSGPVVPVLSIPGQRQLSFSDITKGLSWTKLLPGIPGLPVTSQIMNLVGPNLEPAGSQEPTAKPPAATGLPTAATGRVAAPARTSLGRFTPAPLAAGQNLVVGAQKNPQSLTAMTQKATTETLGSLKTVPTSNGEGASMAGGKFWDNLSTAGGGTVKRVEDPQQGTRKGGNAAAGGGFKENSSSSHDGPASWAPQAPKTHPDSGTRSPFGGAAGVDESAVGGRQADDAPDLGRTPQYSIPGGDLEQGAPTAAPPVALIALKLVGQGFILSDSGPDFSEKKTVNGSPSQSGENTPSSVASPAVADEAYSAFQSMGSDNGMNDLRDAVSAAPHPYAMALGDAGAAELISFTSPATLLARSRAAARRAAIPPKEPPFGGRRPAPRSGEPWFLLLPLAALAVRYRTEFL